MRGDLVARIDRAKAIAYFDRTEGWTPEEVDEQVLTPLADKSIMGTAESDPLSIMCYQLPGSIMKDGKPIKGGSDINPRDSDFAARLYPKGAPTSAPKAPQAVMPSKPLERASAEDVRIAPIAPVASPTAESGPRDGIPVVGSDTFHLVVMASGNKTTRGQILAHYGSARVLEDFPLEGDADDAARRWDFIDAHHNRIKEYVNDKLGEMPSNQELQKFGEQLFETLFPGAAALRHRAFPPAAE
jgi:hypothetical protein